MRKIAIFALVWLWPCMAIGQGGPAKTTIQDTIANLTGTSIVNNQLTITLQQTMTTADGFVILQGTRTTVTVPSSGQFSIALPPNLGSSPSGTYYDVTYQTPAKVFRETWIVPESATSINLLAVRSLAPPIPSPMMAFAQISPPSPCAPGNFVRRQANGWDCFAPSGSGTVTSVGLTVPSWLNVSGSPVIAAGALTVLPAVGQTSHQVIGTCGTGTSFAPCALGFGDISGTVAQSQIPWATPGSIGSTTPGSGAFSTLTINANNALAYSGVWTSGGCIQATATPGVASVLSQNCGTGGGGAHALLSATHNDTTAHTVVRGDLIAGIGAAPTWQAVSKGGTNAYPKWNASGDVVASTLAAAGIGSPTACTNQFVTTFTLNADAAPTSTCASANYQTIQQGGTGQTPRGILNFINGTNMTITCADNVTKTDCTFTSSATGATAWSAITAAANANAGAFSASGNSWDWTATTGFKLRAAAGLASAANGDFGYDTTATNWHAWNGADRLVGLVSGAIANNDCAKFTVTGSKIELASNGAACGAGGGTVTSSSSAQYNAAVFTSTTNIQGVAPTANGQCFMSAASNYATSYPSFQTCPGGGSGTVSANSTANARALAAYAAAGGSTTVGADTAAYTDGAGNLTAVSVTTTGTSPDTFTPIADGTTANSFWLSSTTANRFKAYVGGVLRQFTYASDLGTAAAKNVLGTGTNVATSSASAPASNKCLEMDTNGNIVIAGSNSTCGAGGAGTVTTTGTPAVGQLAVMSGGASITSYTGLTSDASGNVTATSITTTGTGPDTFTAIADGTTANSVWLSSTTANRFKAYVGGALKQFTYASDLGTAAAKNVLGTGTNVTTTSASAPAGNRCVEMDTNGNLVLAAAACRSGDFPDVHYVPSANCNNASAATAWSLPATNPPTVACRTGTNVQGGVLQFTATTQSAQFQIGIPNDWDSAVNPSARIFLVQGNANTGQTITMTLATGCGATDDQAFNAANSFSNITTNATAYTETEATIAAITMTGCAAGGLLDVKIGTSSLGTNQAWVQMVSITFPRLLTAGAN